MRDLVFLAVQLVVTLAKLTLSGGVRSVVAESLLLKHQLIIGRRSSRRAPPLTTIDRFMLGLFALFVSPRRVAKLASVLQIANAFGVAIDKGVVRRVLAKHYGPDHPHVSGPSWLTFFAHAKAIEHGLRSAVPVSSMAR